MEESRFRKVSYSEDGESSIDGGAFQHFVELESVVEDWRGSGMIQWECCLV